MVAGRCTRRGRRRRHVHLAARIDRAGQRGELGYLPCDTRAADILYNIVSRRHEQRSTIITTNLSFKQWGNTFPGACVVALVDRFAQHCHRVEIIGDSYRDKHRLDPDRPKPTTKSRLVTE